MPIARLSDFVIKTLNSGQVCTDVVSIVKELLENALDASATNINLVLDGSGLDRISITDNGNGIASQDRELVAKRHCTSKLSSYEELGSVRTYGFRGEALASIVDIAQSFTLTTRTESDEIAVQYAFNSRGQWKIVKSTADIRGTSVIADKLFHTIPVRRQKLRKDAYKILPALRRLLTTYHLVRPQARISLTFRSGKKGESPVSLVLPSRNSEMDALLHSFGSDLKQCIESKCQINGYDLHSVVPEPTKPASWLAKKGFYLYVDDRPIQCLRELPARIKEVVQSKIVEAIPTCGTDTFAFLNIRCPCGIYDPNIEPSKCTVLMEDPEHLVEAIETLLRSLYTRKASCASIAWDSTENTNIQSPNSPQLQQNRKTSIIEAQRWHDQAQDSLEMKSSADLRPSTIAATVDNHMLGPRSPEMMLANTRSRSWMFSMLDQVSSEDDNNNLRPSSATTKADVNQFRSRSASSASEVDYVPERSVLSNPWIIAKLVTNKNKGQSLVQPASTIVPDSSDSMHLESASSQTHSEYRGTKRVFEAHASSTYLSRDQSSSTDQSKNHKAPVSRRVPHTDMPVCAQHAVKNNAKRHHVRLVRSQTGIDNYLRPRSDQGLILSPKRTKRKVYTAPSLNPQGVATSAGNLKSSVVEPRTDSQLYLTELRSNIDQSPAKPRSKCLALERTPRVDHVHNFTTTITSDYMSAALEIQFADYEVFNYLEPIENEIISEIVSVAFLTSQPLEGNICLLKIEQSLGGVALLAGFNEACKRLVQSPASGKLVFMCDNTELVRIW